MSNAVQVCSRQVELSIDLSIASVIHHHDLHDHRYRQGEHVCAGDLIYLPYRGLFVCHVGMTEVIGDANQVVFLRSGDDYRINSPGNEGSSALSVAPRPDVIREIESGNGVGPRLRSFTRTRAACARVQLLRARLLHRVARGSMAGDLELEELVLALLRCVLERQQPAEHAVGAKTARLIRHAKEFLSQELSNPVRLGDVGRAVGASPVYLTELFRRIEGLSLHQYLTRLRLARGLAELPDSDDLTALALEIGFSSHSHFSAVFRRVFGCTPSQCRSMLRESSRRMPRSAARHVLGAAAASERRPAAGDRLTFGARHRELDVVEPVSPAPFEELEHALASAGAIVHDDLTRRSRGLLFASRATHDPE